MNGRTITLAAATMTALLAVLTSNAFATARLTTNPSHWSTSGTGWGTGRLSGRTPKCSAGANFVLEGTVAEAHTKITATGLSCTGILWNESASGVEMAVGEGTIAFTGITVDEPSGCKLNEEPNGGAMLRTETLQISAEMHDREVSPEVFEETPIPVVTFKPAAITAPKFATIHLTGCAAEGRYKVEGMAIGEASHPTGTGATDEILKFNATTNAAGTLTLASNPATITGVANNELSTGASFQVI